MLNLIRLVRPNECLWHEMNWLLDCGGSMNLLEAEVEKKYIVKEINTEDEELDAFLFSLGCYSGEPITVISHLKGGCVVSIKDARYNIDKELASVISI